MARSKEVFKCEFFAWKLFLRDDTWYGDGRGNTPNLGKHSLGTKDRDTAIKELAKLDRAKAIELKLAVPDPAGDGVALPIDGIWTRYLKYVGRPEALGGVGPATSKRYRAVKDKHLVFCKSHHIDDWRQVNASEITAYGTYLHGRGKSVATLYLECTLLKQIIKWLIEVEKALPESHRVRLQIHRSEESDTYCPTREEVAAMIMFCQERPELNWLAEVIVALATTGMRIGELCALRWSDINFDADTITLPDNRHSGRRQKLKAVRTNKGRRTRRLPIHARLKIAMEKMARRADGRVFGGPRGGVLKADTVRRILVEQVIEPLKARFPTPPEEVGFQDCRLHSFRHYFVSQAFLGGASEGEIRDWVGHRDSRIIERYRHLRDKDAKRKMNAIPFLDDVPSPATLAAEDSNKTNQPMSNPVAPPKEAAANSDGDPEIQGKEGERENDPKKHMDGEQAGDEPPLAA